MATLYLCVWLPDILGTQTANTNVFLIFSTDLKNVWNCLSAFKRISLKLVCVVSTKERVLVSWS